MNFNQLVVFNLDEHRYALSLSCVERAVRMVEISLLPKAPEIILGVVNFQGQVIPVLNIRRRFRLPEREPGVSDQLLVACTSRRTVALVVDLVTGVEEVSEREAIHHTSIVPGLEYLSGVVKLHDGMLLIHDLDSFLSLQEEEALDAAVEQANR